MVINHQREWIYCGAPKTGSCSLHYLLSFPPFGGECAGLASRDEEIPHQHDCEIPADCRYRIVASVRNPYSRAVSLFEHYRRDWPGDLRGLRFDVFLDQVLRPTVPDVDPFYTWTCHRWYAQLPRIDHVLHLESLTHDLKAAGLGEEPYLVPQENKHVDCWQRYYRWLPEALAVVRDWAAADFDRWGYTR